MLYFVELKGNTGLPISLFGLMEALAFQADPQPRRRSMQEAGFCMHSSIQNQQEYDVKRAGQIYKKETQA